MMPLESPAIEAVISTDVNIDAVTEANHIRAAGSVRDTFSCCVTAVNIGHTIRADRHAGLDIARRPVIHHQIFNVDLRALNLNIHEFATVACFKECRRLKVKPGIFFRLDPGFRDGARRDIFHQYIRNRAITTDAGEVPEMDLVTDVSFIAATVQLDGRRNKAKQPTPVLA